MEGIINLISEHKEKTIKFHVVDRKRALTNSEAKANRFVKLFYKYKGIKYDLVEIVLYDNYGPLHIMRYVPTYE